MIPAKLTRNLIKSFRRLLLTSVMNELMIAVIIRNIYKHNDNTVLVAVGCVLLGVVFVITIVPWLRYINTVERVLNDKISEETYEMVTLLRDNQIFENTEIDWKKVSEAAMKLEAKHKGS